MQSTDATNPSSNPQESLKASLAVEAKRFANIAENIATATSELLEGAENLNKSFLGSRERMDEFLNTLREATPEMRGLGASTKEVYDTLAQIAVGNRRQVIAQEQDLRNIFSASKLVGKTTNELVDAFSRVGYDYSKVSKNVLDSITQIRSFGLNARLVMDDVLKNTDQLSRFSFENGVEGLTRMAAQASMLRFDMSQTFQLAESVLDPDKAVSVASAFQRLGVAAGNLVDPMALLNQSLTDPTGLQNSLINVAKQFTYFDEQTNSFRINPQGILTLKEIEAQTGVSAKTMREAALAAADLDRRIAQINKNDQFLNIDENDKQLIANISRIGDKGQLEVKVSRPGEIAKYVELSKMNKAQIDKVLEEQKRFPETIEEVQKAQLTTSEKMLAEFRRLNAIVAGTTLNAPGYMGQLQEVTGNLRENLESMSQSTIPQMEEKMREFYTKLEKPDITETERNNIYRDIAKTMVKFGDDMGKNFVQLLSESVEGTFAQDAFQELFEGIKVLGISTPTGTGVKAKKPTGVTIPADEGIKPKKYKPIYGPSSSTSPMGGGFIMPGASMPGASINIKIDNNNSVNNPKFALETNPDDITTAIVKGGTRSSEILAEKLIPVLEKYFQKVQA